MEPPLARVSATKCSRTSAPRRRARAEPGQISSVAGNRRIVAGGSDSLKERFLPPFLDGSLHISFAVTEPDAGERVVFDRPIGQNQAVQHPLAEAQMRLDAAELMCLQAAWLFDRGLPCAKEANMAKYLAAEDDGRAALVYEGRHIDMAHTETARQWLAMAATLGIGD